MESLACSMVWEMLVVERRKGELSLSSLSPPNDDTDLSTLLLFFSSLTQYVTIQNS